MRYWIGIDPGKAGGVARVWDDGTAEAWPLAFIDKEMLDTDRLVCLVGDLEYRWVRGAVRQTTLAGVVVERVTATPHMKSPQAFAFGRGYGQILGVAAASLWRHDTVTPRVWQKAVLGTIPKGTSKQASAAYVRRVYPTVDLIPGRRIKPHDGMSDAVCLADYARNHGPFKR